MMSRKALSIRTGHVADRAAVAPLGAHQAHQREEDDRHVPELALFHRRDAAARVADVLGQPGGRLRRVETAARLLGNPPQRPFVHRRDRRTRRRSGPRAERDAAADDGRPPGRIDRHLVGPRLGADERAAIQAVALPGPLERHVGRAAARQGHAGGDAGVVELDVGLVHDRRFDGDRLARLDAVDRRPRLDDAGDAVDEPPQHLPPVVLVRLILERDAGVHLPLPGVLQRQRNGLAAPVLVPCQHRLRAAALVGPGQQHRGGRLRSQRRVDARRLRQVAPARGGRRLAWRRSAWPRATGPARVGRICRRARVRRLRRARARIDRQRQRVGDRRAAVAAFGKRRAPPSISSPPPRRSTKSAIICS